ncbi:MAG: hypothetical protein K0S33_586 [Bacteroidetes bacterium]|jgi:hypothetical protein|nr:hypothetical protein [Bacteroidota bacterium]
MIEVYKTNVQNPVVAEEIIRDLHRAMPDSVINFDLEDCDRILRIDSSTIPYSLISESLSSKGFVCEVLE